MDHLKSCIDKLLPAQLKANDVAFINSIDEVKEDLKELDDRVKNLVAKLATSASSLNATIDAILDNISTLLAAQEVMQADIEVFKKKNSSMR